MPGQWQFSVNQDQRVGLSDTETVQINLSKANFTAEVAMKMAVTNGATTNTQTAPNTVIDGVTRIEILANGGDVKNYRGYECVKWAHLIRRTPPGYDRLQTAAGVQNQVFPILFNRFFGDELCMLPSKLYKTLVLKVQTSFPISATTGFATLTEKLDVYELEFVSDDAASSKIILRELEVQQYTTVASGAVRTPNGGLPLGNLITKVLLHEYQAATDDGVDITYVRLGINNFSEIPIGLVKWLNMQDKNKTDYNLEEDTYSCRLMVGNTGTRNTRLSRIKAVATGSGTAIQFIGYTAIAGDRLTFSQSDLATPTTVAGNTENSVILRSEAGIAYCVVLDLDPLSNFSGGIKSSNVNSVDLEVTNAAASGLLVISMQEAITVPVTG